MSKVRVNAFGIAIDGYGRLPSAKTAAVRITMATTSAMFLGCSW
jgi:hypothetical protein